MGTYGGGLYRYQEETGVFHRYFHLEDDPQSLSSNSIYTITEDFRGNLWVGTHGGGLNRFNAEENTFTAYRQGDGLPGSSVYGILEDSNGYLWLSTNRGLGKFNPRNGEFNSYSRAQGFLNTAFHPYSYHRDPDGKLFFGGSHGLIGFYPREIIPNPQAPPVVLTGFFLFNRQVVAGPPNPESSFELKKAINYTDRITLGYRQNVIAIEFSALNYLHSHKNRYSYRLEGFNREWISTNYRHRRITYTNLPAGTYTFRVKGSNNDGIWNENPASLQIEIMPPFWQTFWFRLIVAVLVMILIYYLHTFRIRRIEGKLNWEIRLELFCRKNGLSKREIEVVKLLLKGKSNREIEDLLYISINTVKNHIYHIYQKIGVESRHGLITLINDELKSHEPDE